MSDTENGAGYVCLSGAEKRLDPRCAIAPHRRSVGCHVCAPNLLGSCSVLARSRFCPVVLPEALHYV